MSDSYARKEEHIDEIHVDDAVPAGGLEDQGHEGLGGPEQMKVVRAKKDGTPAITDGPFPESKEVLAGYWVVDLESPQRAYGIAAHASTAPGCLRRALADHAQV